MNAFLTFMFLAIFCLACGNKNMTRTSTEPTDPDMYDMSVWEAVKPGIYSGFGSIDIAYPKSIPPAGNITDSIKLQGWKGERVNCILIVWTAGSKENITIEASSLSSGNNTIGQDAISIHVIKYVLTDEFLNEKSSSCGPRNNDKIPSHLSPDLLSNDNHFNLDAPGTRPVWISINIPANVSAGIYTGSITRKSSSGIVNHKINLEVINKQLPAPSEWTFHLDLWQNPFAVARFHGVGLWSEEHIDLLRHLLEKLAHAGQKCITTTIIDKPWGDNKQCYDDYRSMINWTRKKDGTWEYDYSVFDKYVTLAMECGIKKQINCYSMVPINNKFSWFDEETSETVVLEAIPGTKEYENIWRNFLLGFRAHLKEKGWLEMTTIALDEREENEMSDLFRFLKETAPEFKVAMAGFYYKPINSSIYDFSSNFRDYGRIPGDAIKSRKNSGLITTYYVACGIPKPNNFTFSPPAESCYEGWLAAAMGFDGFLRWAYNSWPENPLIDSRYIMWPAGDTYLIYPGALSSVRFERLREGIQDYEKIRILREELAAISSEKTESELKRLNNFLDSIDSNTLNEKSAAEVINEGKLLLYEIAKSVF